MNKYVVTIIVLLSVVSTNLLAKTRQELQNEIADTEVRIKQAEAVWVREVHCALEIGVCVVGDSDSLDSAREHLVSLREKLASLEKELQELNEKEITLSSKL